MRAIGVKREWNVPQPERSLGTLNQSIPMMHAMYSIFKHRHNFAVWAAARASQRTFTSVSRLKDALEASELPLVVQDPAQWPICGDQFDRFHHLYCSRIVNRLTTAGVAMATYGRAAKLVAIYLKSMIVVSEHTQSVFAAIIHPPIDRTVLQNLARDPRFNQGFRHQWRNLSWTTLSEGDYFALITQLRQNGLDKPAFWMLERYWDPTGDSEA
jgi:hypothetical protein